MADADLDALERRLEGLEREAAALRRELRAARQAAPAEPARGTESPVPSRGDPAARGESDQAGRPAATARPGTGSAEPGARAARARAGRLPDAEEWLGRKGLLVVGLLALVAAAGFLLKYAFDQGWVSPGLRVMAGLVGGLTLGAYGERLQRRGLVAYGGALVGGGAAVAYLALWAAAGPYALVPPAVGILGLALLSGLLLASAMTARVEALAAVAAAGAFSAPALLGSATASPEVLLAYAALVGVAAGGAAARLGWHWAFATAAAGYFLLPIGPAVGVASDWAIVPYLTLGGAGTLATCRSRGWGLLRLLFFPLVWSLLAVEAAEAGGGAAWLLFLLLPALSLPALLRYLGRRTAGGEILYVTASAAAWAGVALLAEPPPLDGAPGLLPALVALPYLVLARGAGRASVQAVGLALLAWGAAAQWEGLALTGGLAAVAVAAAALSRPAALAPARWVALAAGVLAASRLFSTDLAGRAVEASAFGDGWALACAAVLAALALAAGPLWGEPPQGEAVDRTAGLRSALWVAAGLVLLGGGTVEVHRAFGGADPTARPLVADLAASAWWLLYAGALVAWGFVREVRAVRLAGLGVTALAVGKVALYDLTRLEALYRVASFALLAGLALAVAYVYHRRGAGQPAEPT